MRNYLRYTLLSCILLSLLPTHADDHTHTIPIHTITIRNKNGTIPAEHIQNHIIAILNLPENKNITPHEKYLQTITKKLFQHGYVTQINTQKINQNTYTLAIIILQQYPKIKAIHWSGITPQEKKIITEKLNLNREKIWYNHTKETCEIAIENYLKSLGYHQAHVIIKAKKNNNNNLALHIKIQKNRQYYLGNIYFKNTSKNDTYTLAQQTTYARMGTLPYYNTSYQRLLKNIQNSAFHHIVEDLIRTIKSAPRFNESKIADDAQKIETYYKNNGYLDACVTYELTTTNNRINVTFHINKKKLYTIANITWIGNLLISDHALNKSLNLYPGDPYKPTTINQWLTSSHKPNTLHTLYQQTQHSPSAHITIKGVENNQLYLNAYIHEKPYPTIKKINLHTTGAINEKIIHTILSENNISPGEKLNPIHLEKCKKNLAQTNLFHSHTISFNIEETGPEEVIIDFYAIEADTTSLQVGMDQSHLNISIEKDNFSLKKLCQGQKPLGGGENISLNLTNKYLSSKYYIGGSYTNPWYTLYNQRIPITFQGFRKCEMGNTTAFQYSLALTQPYQKPYPHHFYYALDHTYQHIDKPYNTGSLQLGYHQDLTNHYPYPTEGYKIDAKLKTTLLFNSTSHTLPYLQALLHYHHFYTLPSTDITLRYRLSAGLSTNNNPKIPLNKFILSDNLFTRFNKNLVQPYLLPLRGYTNDRSHQHGITQSFELYYPLSKKIDTYGLLFFDIAFTNHGLNPIIGFEIRIPTPICIISIYLYYPNAKGHIGFKIRLLSRNTQ